MLCQVLSTHTVSVYQWPVVPRPSGLICRYTNGRWSLDHQDSYVAEQHAQSRALLPLQSRGSPVPLQVKLRLAGASKPFEHCIMPSAVCCFEKLRFGCQLFQHIKLH